MERTMDFKSHYVIGLLCGTVGYCVLYNPGQIQRGSFGYITLCFGVLGWEGRNP